MRTFVQFNMNLSAPLGRRQQRSTCRAPLHLPYQTMKSQLRFCTAAALVAAAFSASATEFSFGGYGTLSAVRSNSDTTEFRANWRQDKGSHGNFDFGVDSRLGVQATAKFNDRFSATGQLLAIRRDGRAIAAGVRILVRH